MIRRTKKNVQLLPHTPPPHPSPHMQTRPPAAKPPYATYLPLSSYPASPCFPFFSMIVLHCISEHEVQTKNRPGGGRKKRAATTFCAAPMTSLLQGASFTVGMISSDRREFLGLLRPLCFAEIKEMIGSSSRNSPVTPICPSSPLHQLCMFDGNLGVILNGRERRFRTIS